MNVDQCGPNEKWVVIRFQPARSPACPSSNLPAPLVPIRSLPSFPKIESEVEIESERQLRSDGPRWRSQWIELGGFADTVLQSTTALTTTVYPTTTNIL